MSDWNTEPIHLAMDEEAFKKLDRHVEMLRDMANGYRASQGLPLIRGKNGKKDLILEG